jgi:hypothetical protein
MRQEIPSEDTIDKSSPCTVSFIVSHNHAVMDLNQIQPNSTGETPHMCDICQEQFKDPSSCSRHRKEQHEGNYVCFVDGCRKARVSSIPHAHLQLTHYPCSIARKSNFRKHLQGHRAYRPDIVFENHWVRRDQPRPKRTGRKSGPSKSRVATKVDNPPPISFKPEAQEERFGPIEVPQLYVTRTLRIIVCLAVADESRHRCNVDAQPDASP